MAEAQKLDAGIILRALEAGGVIAQRLPGYENRTSQLDLMRLIIRGFNEDALIAAEAGTGVGKSFAYLLPALSYAVLNDERVILSTATIPLQQQLYEKDIPLVMSGLGKKLKVVLVKGRGNYLCLRRLDDALRERYMFDDNDYRDLQKVAEWAKTSPTGGRSDLTFTPAEALWSKICSEADSCLGARCPDREQCFVLALRKACADARILVVNHHLLFADLAARHEGAGYAGTVVLPPYARIVLDEAHTLEASATSFFSKEFSRFGIYHQLGRLYRKRRGQKQGLLLRLLSDQGEEKLAELEAGIQDVRDCADALDKAGLELGKTDGVFRLTRLKEGLIEEKLTPGLRALKKALLALLDFVGPLLSALPEENYETLLWDIRVILRRFDAVEKVCSAFIDFKNHPEEVIWMERRSGSVPGEAWMIFRITPIDVASSLKEALFKPNKTVICVSATLTVNQAFEYWKGRSGFALAVDREILTGQFPSPFPYSTAVLLAAPRDAPLPDEKTYRAFVDQAVPALMLCAKGSALALFTSYEALRSAYTAALPLLQEQGILCLKQGDDDRNRLLQKFLQDEKSVLFATDSFWEGVDAPGNTLRMVILCRLPFKAPTDPVFEARCETIEQRGGNAFMDLSLPESVMKFKQGFGRLMRRSSDRGVVAVLDGRILHKRYGAFFLQSLPKTKTNFSNFEMIIKETDKFLFSHNVPE
ncbi:MAG: ATP-dependent DNA helicase DinG [Spirochaetaceae bacterium]|jgi:ATP-dependent DNA helicase DinG|nr:ATP-dependent DNA helicase DinG [Spirochaetaceae bacterium]